MLPLFSSVQRVDARCLVLLPCSRRRLRAGSAEAGHCCSCLQAPGAAGGKQQLAAALAATARLPRDWGSHRISGEAACGRWCCCPPLQLGAKRAGTGGHCSCCQAWLPRALRTTLRIAAHNTGSPTVPRNRGVKSASFPLRTSSWSGWPNAVRLQAVQYVLGPCAILWASASLALGRAAGSSGSHRKSHLPPARLARRVETRMGAPPGSQAGKTTSF